MIPTAPGLDFYVGDHSNKPVTPGSAVNVIYFTNKCNLACTYCYEDLANRPPQIMNKEDIRNAVDAILRREDPTQQTLICLFGGEPTLEWDNVCYLMDYAWQKKRNIHFNLTSNGIKFLSPKFVEQYKNNWFQQHNMISLDISFDGIGNKERIYHNGEQSTSSVIKVFKILNDVGIKYRIRYTIHNLNIHMLYEDMSRIIKTFGPTRLITSVAWSTLSEAQIAKLKDVRDQLRNDWINSNISVPICELFCDMCNGCGERKELKTYFSDEGNVTTYGNYENSPEFHDFKPKDN